MPTDNQGSRSRSGGMSVSLSSPDGRVVGGGVAGLLVAAGPVQVNIPLSTLRSYSQLNYVCDREHGLGGRDYKVGFKIVCNIPYHL